MLRVDIVAEVRKRSTEYFNDIEELEGVVPTTMLIDFVLEKYSAVRNFPAYFTGDEIAADMYKNISTISMAVVDLYMKIGAEGETSHAEKNIKRVYENAYISASLFQDILPFVRVF